MKAFKNYNGPGGGSGAGGFHGPGGGSNSNPPNVKGALISSLARVTNSSRGVIRPIPSSLAVDSTMYSPPVCVSETRSFIRGL